jgi:hypothetical protein
MIDNRFDRQIRLFGTEGQAKIGASRVAVIGAGGTGSIIIPQLALLGVGHLTIVDHDEIEQSNRNRHFCARTSDPVPGTLKVAIAARAVREYNPSIVVNEVPCSLLSPSGFKAVVSADFVFGCIDLEGVRLVLLELCAAYAKPYIDIATGVEPGPPAMYGGRVCCAVGGDGCLACLGQLDMGEAAMDLETPEQQGDREAVYGVAKGTLGMHGPAVVSINAVTASLAVTEFMKLCAGIDTPTRLLKYDGRMSRVSVSLDQPAANCYYCKGIWGTRQAADIERYIRRMPPE